MCAAQEGTGDRSDVTTSVVVVVVAVVVNNNDSVDSFSLVRRLCSSQTKQAAATVPPTELRARSTPSFDQGKPTLRCSLSV